MVTAPKITKIELTEFEYSLSDIGAEGTISIPQYKKGSTLNSRNRVVRVFTDEGATGEYAGGSATEHSAIGMFANAALGQSAFAREKIYNDAKQALRQHARMGMSQVDMALWDLAGKFFDVPVYQLLGEQRTALPAYASTYVGDREPDGLNSPEAYADFAEQCLEQGYRAFKIHPLAGRADRRARKARRDGRRARRRPHGPDAGPVLRHPDLRRRGEGRKGVRRLQLLLVGGPVQGRRRFSLRP